MKKWILLVEDCADDILLTRIALEQNEIANELVVARDGVEAIAELSVERIAGRGELPTVVLLDLNLPKINGMEVLKHIRFDQRTQRIPIVILSSSEEERDLIESYALGANSYVKKPVDFDEFVDAVKVLGFYWLTFNLSASETV
jgi:two-component system response regulator